MPLPAISLSAADTPGFSTETNSFSSPYSSLNNSAPPDATTEAKVERLLVNMPLLFIENQGQTDKQVSYYIQGRQGSVYFTSQGMTMTFVKKTDFPEQPERGCPFGIDKTENIPRSWTVKLDFIDAYPGVIPRGQEKAETQISYFKGEKDKWKTGLPTYTRLVYADLWPGIDLVFYCEGSTLKYEFIVQTGADPANIRLAWRGAEQVSVNQKGQMEIKTPLGSFADDAPLAWQVESGKRSAVKVSYCLNQSQQDNTQWGFNLNTYDTNKQLIIDPAVIDYCGYIGGSGMDWGSGIAVDSLGRAYVTGRTDDGTGFPVSAGALDDSHNGNPDVFVARVNVNGTAFEYCGFIGGSQCEWGERIAVDSIGRAYVIGPTNSTQNLGFPVSGGLCITHKGMYDTFVARINPDGSVLEYCGYIGGSNSDWGKGIAVDSTGQAYVTGYTQSADFPASVRGLDSSYNGGCDAFVARINASGTALDYCGYIGGSGDDIGRGIAVDSIGQAYVTGNTESNSGFPIGLGAFDNSYNGNRDAFVAKVNVNGTALDYCSYIGGSQNDEGFGIAVDGSGRAYITGDTWSADFPFIVGPNASFNGGVQVFVARITSDGSNLEYCGYINEITARSIVIDSNNRAYITGGCYAFVARVKDDGKALDYLIYIMGTSGNHHSQGIALDNSGRIYVAGSTDNYNFQPVVGPDTSFNGGQSDAFVARVCFLSSQSDIISFTLPQQTGAATINTTAHTVNIEVAYGTDRSSLIPTIGISEAAVIDYTYGTPLNFTNPVNFTITAEDGSIQTWTVTVTVHPPSTNANLSNITISDGTITPGFNPAYASYNVSVLNSVTSIKITPTGQDFTANIKVNGNDVASGAAYGPINLNVGNNLITILVTAEDTSITKTYNVTVTRAASNNAYLSKLDLSSGILNPGFSAGHYSYTASVANLVSSINITPTTQNSNAIVKINGNAAVNGAPYGPINLVVGPNTLTILITAQDTITTKTYTVTVTRLPSSNAGLSGLSLSSGILSPGFNAGTTTYTASVDNDIANVSITPTLDDSNASVKVNESIVTSGTASNPIYLNVGDNIITVLITAQDMTTTKTYTLTVTRLPSSNADLSGLSLSSGILSPGFDAGTTNYTAVVGNEITNLNVTCVTESVYATLTINGNIAFRGVPYGPVNLAIGANPITISVTAQDNVTTKGYTLTVHRAPSSNARLSELSLSQGDLIPAFDPAVMNYSVNLPYTADRLIVTPTVSDNVYGAVTVNNQATVSGVPFGPISLNHGSNIIDINVTAQDGSSQTYTINANRAIKPLSNADLANLSLSQGRLIPTFAPGITSYRAYVTPNNTSINITATVAESVYARVTIDNTPAISGSAFGPINLNIGNNNVVIRVTAQDGSLKDYNLIVIRLNNNSDSSPQGNNGVIDSRGGSATGLNVIVTIPPGAVEERIRVEISRVVDTSWLKLVDGAKIISDVMEIVKDKSCNFKKNVTISIKFDPSSVDESKYDLKICYYDNDKQSWVPLDNNMIDKTTQQGSGEINHLTKFALIAFPRTAAVPTIQPSLAVSANSEGVELNDISGHWAEKTIQELIDMEIISGYPDGSFKPDKIISRAEFAVILVKALRLQPSSGKTFKDSYLHWAKDYISAAYAAGIIKGFNEDNFGPDENIIREEMAVMIFKAAQIAPVSEIKNFKNLIKISGWAREAVAAAITAGIIKGYPDGSFRPKAKTTRAEAASIIIRIIK
ncbi:cadherin-like beta sandwich domain-containing protein [Syntrophomonas palmitatica]|uniref:cadherin-like beta sandwich domain-containing protein n=1 Tax=Syntrophomonas palmitatica TaxID=402877 RepID=UPI0009FA4345|nr:cadherin-like beta sandwich domain-containing protein [Syntrophomonas palmitatica]